MAAKRERREKGTGSIFQRSSDKRWVGYVTLPEGPGGKERRRTVTAKRREDVEERLRKVRRDLLVAGDLPTSSPTMAQWSALWLAEKKKKVKPGTYVSYEGPVRRYIVPAIGKVRLDKLTTASVTKVHDYITEDLNLSSTTALGAHRILAKCLTDAMRQGRVTRNVATLVDAPQKAVGTRGAYSAQQAITLLKHAAKDPYGAVHWSLALAAGLRQGERLGLTRGAIDLDAGLITVTWQLQRLRWEHGCLEAGKPAPAKGQPWPCGRKRGGSCPSRHHAIPPGHEVVQVEGGLYLTRPKSRAGWREVPMTPLVSQVLTRHLEAVPAGMCGLVLHRGDASGRPIDPSDDSTAWHRAVAAAGLPDVPLHAARHTTATLLHALKVPEQTRIAIMGHSSATVTAGYTHVAGAETMEAMQSLGTLLTLEE
ncbi:tyrosine-type recombinase/integrase [Antribacter gilvus]|uniref:tyrosine-type recombinase/integrase n=1 Tax=Antribacter gilvus TaxID=2304675 RepID=UPI000F771A15|nr:site-specific integrase [Antribacter gilvus]